MDKIEELRARLKNKEDNLIERKPLGAVGNEAPRQITAFSNSIPQNSTAVLFIGVNDDGSIGGVTNVESIQNTIRYICKYKIFPPVDPQIFVLTESGKDIVAVEVKLSKDRPHIVGRSYIRRGDSTQEASREEFDRVITSRTEKAKPIVDRLNEYITVSPVVSWPTSTPVVYPDRDGQLTRCDFHSVTFRDVGTVQVFTALLSDVDPSWDNQKNRFSLIIRFRELPSANFVADYFKQFDSKAKTIHARIQQLYPQGNKWSWGSLNQKNTLRSLIRDTQSMLETCPDLRKHPRYHFIEGSLLSVIQCLDMNAGSFDGIQNSLSQIFSDLATIAVEYVSLF